MVDVKHIITTSRDEYPRLNIDRDTLGGAIRGHGKGLRRFELELYNTADGRFEGKDCGVLGNLRVTGIDLTWLKAPMSTLTSFRRLDSQHWYLVHSNIPQDFTGLGGYLPATLRYF